MENNIMTVGETIMMYGTLIVALIALHEDYLVMSGLIILPIVVWVSYEIIKSKLRRTHKTPPVKV